MSESLPKGWVTAQLEEVAKIITGNTPPTSHPEYYEGGSIPFIKPTALQNRPLLEEVADKISEAGKLFARIVPADSTLLSCIGVLGKTGITTVLSSFNQQINAVVFGPAVLPKYGFYYCQTLRSYLESVASATTIPIVNKTKLASAQIPVPPLREQQRIVDEIEKQFTRLDAAISSLRHAEQALKNHRAAILRAVCEGRLVPTEAELARVEGRIFESAGCSPKESHEAGLPELPEGWVWVHLQELAAREPNSITDGPFGSNLKTSHYTEDGPRVIRLQNIGDGEFINERAHISQGHYATLRKHNARAGELVIAMLGEKPPRACIVPDWLGEAIVKADCVRFRPDKSLVLPQYLNFALNSEGVRKRTTALVHGVGRPRLNLREIKEIMVPLPPVAEQARIVKEVERQFSILSQTKMAVEGNLQRMGFLRQVILRDAFSGKLVSQSPDDEPAAVLLERIRQSREAAADFRPRRGRGIKPGVSTPETATPTDPKPRRGAGNHSQSAHAPSGLRDGLDGGSLGLKPQALRPGPFGAENTAPDTGPDFLSLSRDEQIDAVWNALLGRGLLEKEEAVRAAAQSLRDQGLASFQRLRQGGPLWEAIAGAVDRGVREGSFDRPRRGYVRALLPDARSYTPEIWRRCLLDSLDHEAVEEGEALRAAAEWARESLGLEFERLREDGVILRGLRAALQEAVRTGEIKKTRGRITRSGDQS